MVKSANADAEASEEPQEDEQEEPATTFGRSSASGAAAAGEEGNAGPATASGGAEEGTGSGPGPLEEEWEDWCEGEEEAWEEPGGAADQSAEAGPKAWNVLHAWQHMPAGNGCMSGPLCRIASASSRLPAEGAVLVASSPVTVESDEERDLPDASR